MSFYGVHGVLLGLGLLAFLRLGLGLGALLAAEYAAAVDGGQDLGLVPRGLFLARAGLGGGLGGLRFGLVPLFRLVLLPGRGLMGLFRLRGGGLRRGVGALPLLRFFTPNISLSLSKLFCISGVLPSNVFAAPGILWLRRCEPAPAPPRTIRQLSSPAPRAGAGPG